MPERIQRKRVAGWRMPAGAVSVTRPGRWGNPFPVDGNGRQAALEQFGRYARARLAADPQWLEPLRGKDLACWCRLPQACHADLLLELANAAPGDHPPPAQD